MNKYKCNLSHTTGCIKYIGQICPGCLEACMDRYNRLVEFLKAEIKQREYVCTTNHAVLLDNAETLLKEIGEA